MRLDRNTALASIGLIIVVVLLAIFVPWKCSAQEAGTFEFSVNHTAVQDEIMSYAFGSDWKADMNAELREHLKNRFSEAREKFRAKPVQAVVLPDEEQTLFTAPELTAIRKAQNVLDRAVYSLRERKKRIAIELAESE